jgi:hypothetical protein
MSVAEQTLEPTMVACALSGEAFKARLASIAELNRASLLTHRRDDHRLELIYAANAREQVLNMVRGEQMCCTFLQFEVHHEPGAVHVVIVAPQAAREMAETMFDAFQSKAQSPAGCACCGVSP